MFFKSCRVQGAQLIESSPHRDDRGRFMRAWCAKEFREQGIDFAPEQANMAFSARAGTLRGLHYQVPPAVEAKVVRCTRGAIFDVLVDLRSEERRVGKSVDVGGRSVSGKIRVRGLRQ